MSERKSFIKIYDERQSKRNNTTSSQFGKKLWADQQLASDTGESKNQIHRYLRLAEVISPILDLVDRKLLAIVTAVEVSYLEPKVQEMIYTYMKENGICKAFQLYALRDYLKEHESITNMELIRILNENAPKNETNKFQKITIPTTKLKEYFPTFYTKSQIENVIFNQLEDWKKRMWTRRDNTIYIGVRIRKFECMKVFPIYQPRVNSQRIILRLQYY